MFQFHQYRQAVNMGSKPTDYNAFSVPPRSLQLLAVRYSKSGRMYSIDKRHAMFGTTPLI